MTLMELLKALIETESQDERMNLVEANKELMVQEPTVESEDFGEKVAQLEQELALQKQKYIDTFFNPTKDEEPETEPEPEKSKNLDELGM